MKMLRNPVLKGLAVAGLAAAAIPAVAAVRMPAEHYDGSIGYVSGGSTRAQARLFERQESRHPLAIELMQRAPRGTEFAPDGWVRVADNRGHMVLDAIANGPFMLVDLPPGQYKVMATLRNRTLKKTAIVSPGEEGVRTTFDFATETGG